MKLIHSSKVVSFFSLKAQGDMSEASVREGFLSKAGVNYRDLVCAEQVHAGEAGCVSRADRGKLIAGADALVTAEKGLPLVVFTADCLSVFLYDAGSCAVALAHAGWRSSSRKITTRTVELMREEFGTLPEGLCAGFGPAIRSCCFEVGEEFEELFPGYLSLRNKARYLDLAQANKDELLESGVKEENIFDSQFCTKCSSGKFFSYRREKSGAGRMISLIMLKKE